MSYFTRFPVTDESNWRHVAAEHGLLSADAPEPSGTPSAPQAARTKISKRRMT